ncbi:peptidoglycan-binding protein [uncultured Thomasclavelia sp.]|uniref:peptidoglycan-binding protein n=1 Tax=uncultured Thomasclavelia sp. TaxID=3025759 RepID=UPI0026214913|nr:peptidoglycan-binding protein [uncultured Thomasclavelia sp.]
MSNVDLVLNQARAWIGCKESNGSHKQIIDVYNAYTPLPRNYKVKYTDSWCMTFVSACFIKAGFANLCPLECSCGQAIELAKQMGIWNEDGSIIPNKGDIIMYDWDKQDGWPEHTGLVESVSGRSIKIAEGNKSNAVGYRTIEVGSSSIRGYIQPKYDGTSTPSTGNENSVNYQVKVNTKSGVNCRTEASVSSAKITAYANGTVLNVTKESNGWLYVNNTGWVSGEYCIRVSGSSSSSSNESWKGDLNYYLNNSAVGVWQNAMNVGFDTNELEVDNKFGAGSQNFAKTHLLWSGQTHNCPTAIRWLQTRLRYYGFNKLSVTGKWSNYLTTCVKTFQKNRGIEADGKVGLVTTYWLLEGTIK